MYMYKNIFCFCNYIWYLIDSMMNRLEVLYKSVCVFGGWIMCMCR